MLKQNLINWSNDVVGQIALDPSIFSVAVREDILHRVVHWQLAKRRSGNHKTKEIGDVSGTTRKPFRQKGTGRARQGSLRSPQFRGGAVIFGPVVRDHGYSLNKKVRQLGLKCALSAKMAQGKLIFMQDVALPQKTKEAKTAVGRSSVLIVTGPEKDSVLCRSVANLPGINVIPSIGLNVYDILRHEHVVLSSAAVEHINRRLLQPIAS